MLQKTGVGSILLEFCICEADLSSCNNKLNRACQFLIGSSIFRVGPHANIAISMKIRSNCHRIHFQGFPLPNYPPSYVLAIGSSSSCIDRHNFFEIRAKVRGQR